MSTVEVRVATLGEFVDAVTGHMKASGRYWWFRGHEDANWPLVPTIFRGHAASEPDWLQRFRETAGPVCRRPPPHSDALAWLLLAQHHGLPTRMLDWTLSPLVGAAFAAPRWKLGDLGKADAVVWAMNPAVCDEWSRSRVQPTRNLSDVQHAFVVRAFNERAPTPGEPFVLLEPRMSDSRQFAQSAVATLHRDATPLERTLDGVNSALQKFVIPARHVASFAVQIANAGVTYSRLFPEPFAVAAEITHWRIVPAASPSPSTVSTPPAAPLPAAGGQLGESKTLE